MDETFPHLELEREAPINDKRPGSGFVPEVPDDTAAHGRRISASLQRAKNAVDRDEGGFDERSLYRFTVEKGFVPEDLPKIVSPEFRDGVEVVSQEGKEVVVAFVSNAALESFEALLATLAGGDLPANKQVFYALQGVDGWSPDDRKGWALKNDGLPDADRFLLDVELWPLEDRYDERAAQLAAFEQWLGERGVSWVDSVKQPGLTLYRIESNREQFDHLLRHRDIRLIDLPPRYGIDLSLRYVDVEGFGDLAQPPGDAPVVTVLDSGLATGHPLLAPAIGDAESFLPGHDGSDGHGHGTLVGGLALYGDFEEKIAARRFVPELRLCSGRILDGNLENNTGFVENHISEAVEYFSREYSCQVFNLSFGDLNKPYLGGHVRDLAFTLDTLAREYGVLFVVSAGNVLASEMAGLEWRDAYPGYLVHPDWSILDPASALNVLTVGSIARHDQTTNSQRYVNDPNEVPVARFNQPSPFTRHGPTIGGALKPDLVAYGGNWAVNTRANALVSNSGLGELSANRSAVTDGRLFADDSGTSFSAPHVAHLAGRIQREFPDAGPDLMRALLVAHARIPQATSDLFGGDAEQIRGVCGYGKVDETGLMRSIESEVTLVASASIPNKKHHFYEVPVPEDFLGNGRRPREVSVALAYTPYVRSTRIDYRATRIEFKLVAANDLEEVSRVFNNATSKADYDAIKDIGAELGANNRDIGSEARKKGTVQSSTWTFRQFTRRATLRNKRLFVVVTRNDFSWGELPSALEESYSLAVVFRDRENDEARMYSQIRNQLAARARGRARV